MRWCSVCSMSRHPDETLAHSGSSAPPRVTHRHMGRIEMAELAAYLQSDHQGVAHPCAHRHARLRLREEAVEGVRV
jgi:hypothetical protein